MLAAQSPLSGHQQLIQGGRKPLQPRNQSATPISSSTTKPKPKPNPAEWIDISNLDNSNKENIPPIYSSTPLKKESNFPIESFDASLAEELTAIREKIERLRIDKEKTEKMLRDRGFVMDLQMKDIVNRGEVQKDFEIQVDRLYRLKEIRLACMRISPLRSLRDKEQEKQMKQDQLKANNKIEGMRRDEHEAESPSQSLNSEN